MKPRTSSPAFVGRTHQLELLESSLDHTAAGHAATVLVAGDAGVGKSRFIAEVAERGRRRGILVAVGTCVPIDDGGLPYGPVIGILRHIVRLAEDPDAAALLGWLTTGSGGPVATTNASGRIPSGQATASEWAKTRLFESVLSCVTQLASGSPLLLVWEDLQWADSASAELLGFLTRNLHETPVLLVGTYRGEELGRGHRLRPWLGELGRDRRVSLLRLEGLGRAEIGQMIAGILDEEPEWALVDAVWARSQGNPFFAEELTAARHTRSLSAELQGVIMSRVEGLSDEAQQVLRCAATIGTSIDHELLVAVTDLGVDALDDAVGELVDRQILVVDDLRIGYQFRHMLLREALDQSLLPGQRARLHLRVATALAAIDPMTTPSSPRIAELAAHWWAAGAWSEALTCSMTAAEAAFDVWAFPEAHAHFERALSALDRRRVTADTPPVDRQALVLRASDAAYLGGASERAVELMHDAIHSVDADGDPLLAATMYSTLGRNALGVGDSDGALDAYRRAAKLLPSDTPSVELARILAEEARGLMVMSRLRDAEVRSREAIAAAGASGARAEDGHARNTLGVCRALLGYYDEGIDLVRQALAIAEDIGDPEDLNRAYGNLSSLLMDSGRLEEATALVFDSAAMGEELWGVKLEAAASNGATALVRLGRYDEAEALMATVGDRGIGGCSTGLGQTRAACEIRRGHLDEADDLLQTVDELTTGLSDVQQRGGFLMLRTELALERGRPDEAYEHIERALALAADTDDECARTEMCAVAVRCLADGNEARLRQPRFELRRARALADGLVADAQRLANAPVDRGGVASPRLRAFVAVCVAERSRLHHSDPERWAAAARLWGAVGEPYPMSYCLLREAEGLLEGRTERGRADDCLQEAWRTSTALGARPLQAKIERLAQRGRIDLRHVDEITPSQHVTIAGDLGLTQREVEVLAKLAAGRTDREIAESLYISKKTASVHVSNLLRKLAVTSRVEAGKVGQLQGL